MATAMTMTMNGAEADGGDSLLSALVDGEVDTAEATRACRAWQHGSAQRRDWHAWHVAGDVLRSEELAQGADSDARFLAVLRVRLAAEAVVLAPAPLPESAFAVRRRRARWMLPTAAAAGFVLVAGTFVAMRTGGVADPQSVDVAAVPPPAVHVAAAPVVVAPALPSMQAATPANTVRLIRDARLDRYLAAHKQFAGSTAPAWSQATLRNATVEVDRP